MAKLKKRKDGRYQRKVTLSDGRQKIVYGKTLAELNATSQKMASVIWKKWGAGRVNAIPASPAPTSICMAMTHHRLVFNRSTKGLQKGLMTHGR